MLGLSFRFHICFRTTYKVFIIIFLATDCLSHLYAFEYADGPKIAPRHCEQEWVSRYFKAIDSSTSIEEMVDFLISFKLSMEAKGYKLPQLTDLCLNLKNHLIEMGIEIDEPSIEAVYKEIIKRESCIPQFSFQRAINTNTTYTVMQIKKSEDEQNKETQVSSKMVCGFLKFIAGGLCCIIPHPAVQAVGASLASLGINDMINAARDQGDKNEFDQKNRSPAEYQQIP